MKNFLKINRNEIIRVALMSLAAVLCAMAFNAFCPELSFCAELFDTAETSLNDLKTKIVELSFAIFPVALIVLLVLIAITHNEKKIALYRSLLITVCIVEGAILLVSRGVVLDLIKELVGAE